MKNNAGDEYLNQILRLQLKKPKSWNWQLTTSKSSPNITLPVIQLYNSKGKLLVETNETGTGRSSWHSSDFEKKSENFDKNLKKESPNSKRNIRPIKKSKSDILDINGNQQNQKAIENKREIQNYCKRSKSTTLSNPYKPLDRYRINIDAKLTDKLELPPPLSKSKSTIFEKKPTKYKKSPSDDLYERLIKYNNEKLLASSREGIKRGADDEYRTYLNPQLQKLKERLEAKKRTKLQEEENKIENDPKNTNITKPILKKYDVYENNSSPFTKPEVNRVKHSKYIARTCSAGTLIIKEESFNSPNVRRRTKITDEYLKLQRPSEFYPNANKNIFDEQRNNPRHQSKAYNLFQSKSDVFPFKHLAENENICEYMVEEPESRKNSEHLMLERQIEKLKRRNFKKRNPGSSDHEEKYKNGGRLQEINARVIKEHNKEAKPAKDDNLLRLVQQLSNQNNNNNAPKMGANVSRHSAKGLSGRRSQSSGSICNGKGGSRQADGKICGSLPSYLDDGTCNNNVHECDKHLEERIPPLGDGAPLHWKFSDNQMVLCDQGYGSERSPEEEYPPPLPEHDNQSHLHLDMHSCYPFITPESIHLVQFTKGSRGLGLSVSGGSDSKGSWPGLIRIKRLFPHQPAASCEKLQVGDLILEVNGVTLTGLTNYEALEVLRTVPNQVELKICRPPPDVLSCVSPISEAPPQPPPRRDPPSSLSLATCSDDEHYGEFEITLRKINNGLGFSLQKDDNSALGHYVRCLVKEPAKSDGRIRPGDKIIAVNEVEISGMSHEDAVQFLRHTEEYVKLRLYRDLAQTPVATLSPTETTPRTSFTKKTQLRQEAVDMLNDIAVRKLIPGNQEQYRRSLSPNTSPRRLRRQPCPSDASYISDSSRHLITDEQFHEGLLKNCSLPLDEDSFNSLFIEDDDSDKPSRPSSLDLYNPNQTPVAARKPKFNFSLAHNAYELNNLDAEILDAPNLTYNIGDDVNSTEVECGDSFPQEPASMPHIPLQNPGFSYKNPAYQSAHPQCGTENVENSKPKHDNSNMKKWKGIVFSADEERERQKVLKRDGYGKDEDNYEILAIELHRGWNSRLGFSLQGAAGVTYVSAVHADSVAAKDGRIRPGDRLIKVNDENVENLSTSEIIDLLRIVRGPVCIIVTRPKNHEDCKGRNIMNTLT